MYLGAAFNHIFSLHSFSCRVEAPTVELCYRTYFNGSESISPPPILYFPLL